MKYYYLSREGPFRNNIVSGKDFDRINRDKSKIVITRINGNFYVLICKNGNYEKEKLVLSYFDLVGVLKECHLMCISLMLVVKQLILLIHL